MQYKKGVKAQISLEYMIIIGFALIITLPLLVIFFSNSSELTENVNTHQAKKIVREVVSAAEKVYYLGEPSQAVVRINMPGGVEDVIIRNKEFLLKVQFRTSITDIYEVSSVNLTGSISSTSGIKNILVQAHEDFVNITEIS